MNSIEKTFQTLYSKLFKFLAREHGLKNDSDKRAIHTQLVIALTMGILMMGHTFIALNTSSSPIPGYVGLLASALHLQSPLLYRFTNNPMIPMNVLLCAGILYQSTFSYFTGGFESPLLISLGILPLLGGMIGGRRGAVFWGLISISVALGFLLLELMGHPFPRTMTPDGQFLGHTLHVFGWIILSSSIVVVYTGLREHSEMLLRDQGQKIDDLFRVLYHDLANPLGRVAIGLSLARKRMTGPDQMRGLELAKTATDNMLEVTENVRKMYTASKGNAEVDFSFCSLNSSIDYIQKIYGGDLERKKLILKFDLKAHAGLHIWIEPISFNNQVLGNIIANAIKFSPPGGTISIVAAVFSPGRVSLEIRDNGIGMPEELVKELFNLNKKTSRPGTNGEIGTGLGMHIVKSFVEMYQGELSVESRESGVTTGTTVRLILKGEKRPL
jgi:signal transduction histidine kinase